jgi:putative ABC transport system permease protein
VVAVSRTYLKSILRAVRHNLGRFLAIFGIVTLGVGFVAGLWATTPDMRFSVDNHFSRQNAADIFIKATMGLTADDLASIAALPAVAQLMPAKVMDAILQTGDNEQLTTRIYGLAWADLLGENQATINRLELLAGRWPEHAGECVMERGYGTLTELALGSTLTVSPEENSASDDSYRVQEYTVVGIARHPFHFSIEREPSLVGSGYLDAIIYVAAECYRLDVFTDAYLTLQGASALTTLTPEYEALVADAVRQLEELGESRSAIRYQQVLSEGLGEIAQARADLAEGRRTAEEELAAAWADLAAGWKELAAARQQLDDGWVRLEEGRLTLAEEKAAGEAEIAQAEEDLAAALIELEDGERQLAAAAEELTRGQSEFEDGLAEFLAGEKELQAAQAALAAGETEYAQGVAELAAARRQLEDGERQLATARAELEVGEAELQAGREQVAAYRAQIEEPLAPVLVLLQQAGLPYQTVDELFAALEADQSAQRAVDGVLQLIREARELELIGLEHQLELVNRAIDELEQLLADVEAGEAELPPGTTPAMLQETLVLLRERRQQLEEGRDPLEDELEQLPESVDELLSGWRQLQAAEAELQHAEAELAAGWQAYHEGEAELAEGWAAYEDGERQLTDGRRQLDENRALLAAAWAELEEGRAQLEEARLELERGWAELEQGRADLDAGWQQYRDGLAQLGEGKETLLREIADAQRQLAEAEAELTQGETDYAAGLQELVAGEDDYWEAAADVERELADAEREIDEAEAELLALEPARWYVLDQNAVVSYATFAMNAEKVDAIATVFPVFFLLVAALVSLTSMMRMVEEERTLIGTMKALGYSRLAIMGKYLGYSWLATAAGSALGLAIGFPLVPWLIWKAFGVSFSLPSFHTLFWAPLALKMTLSAVLLTMLVTLYACDQALRERPAALMRPRAPAAGKRILLEKLGFFWRRLKFSHKSTARNLFRYKRHFYMTVVGVAGCTALLVTGFGLRDSVHTIAETQFQEIMLYDLRIELKASQPGGADLQRWLDSTAAVTGHTAVFTDHGRIDPRGSRHAVDIHVPSDFLDFQEFVHLRSRLGQQTLSLEQHPVVMTEKLAEDLGLRVGDGFWLENSAGKLAQLSLAGICENYVGKTLYLSPEAYRAAFAAEPAADTLLVKIEVDSAAQEDEISGQLLSFDGVVGTQFLSGFRQTMERLVSSIDFMVVVIILAAGALAMIVLFNLININIDERKRELATLRVLGFHQEEVAAYIFRETTILTIIGAVVGLPLGWWLLRFIIRQAESPDLMFGRSITFWSYLGAAVITLLFSLLVDLLMLRKLRQIGMVESMKAVE